MRLNSHEDAPEVHKREQSNETEKRCRVRLAEANYVNKVQGSQVLVDWDHVADHVVRHRLEVSIDRVERVGSERSGDCAEKTD